MRSIITVVGKDTVGILSKVSSLCADHSVNIIEVTQSILQDMFCMIMLVDVNKCDIPFTSFADDISALGKKTGLSMNAVHEDIFNTMHHI